MFHAADRMQHDDLAVFFGKKFEHFGEDKPVLGVAN
jgi:hypothetical protein